MLLYSRPVSFKSLCSILYVKAAAPMTAINHSSLKGENLNKSTLRSLISGGWCELRKLCGGIDLLCHDPVCPFFWKNNCCCFCCCCHHALARPFCCRLLLISTLQLSGKSQCLFHLCWNKILQPGCVAITYLRSKSPQEISYVAAATTTQREILNTYSIMVLIINKKC